MKKGEEKKMLLGMLAVFVLFQWIATELESVRGEAGVVVGLAVVIALVIVQRYLFAGSLVEAARSIGLARPEWSGVIVAVVIAKLMFASVALFSWQTGSTIEMFPNWQLLMFGIFFQAGVGEETLFRGYLFGHLRQRHTFAKAVLLAAIPFVIVHLILFYSLPWPLAGASILLAIAMSFPFSKLFELSGGTIWAPAIVHFAAQAIAKMFVLSGDNAWLFPFFCIAVSAAVPLIVYLVPLMRRLVRRRNLVPAAAAMVLVCAGFGNGQIGGSSGVEFNELQAKRLERRHPCLQRRGFRDVKREGVESFSRRSDAHAGRDACAPVASPQVTSTLVAPEMHVELTGDWDGRRTELRRKGIDMKFRLTQGYQYIARGDAVDRRGGYTGKLDTHFRIDFDKLAGWKGLSAQIKAETRLGRIPSAANAVPINSFSLSPRSTGNAFSITALNFTQIIPVGKESGESIAVGAGKYYSLDSNREPFTGGAGVTGFMNIMANGNPATGLSVPIVSNGATFAWLRNGAPAVTFAIFDPVSSATKIGARKLFRRGITLVPGFAMPLTIAGRSGRHSFSGTVTTRKLTPFDQLAQFVVPGSPSKPLVPKSGSWSATYTFNQYIVERRGADGSRSGWGIFGTFTGADQTTNPVSRFMVVGLGGTRLFKSRKSDRFGIAYAIAGVSKKLKAVVDPVLRVRDEHVTEAFYSFTLTPSTAITGDLQIVRPADASSAVAIVPGARLVVQL